MRAAFLCLAPALIRKVLQYVFAAFLAGLHDLFAVLCCSVFFFVVGLRRLRATLARDTYLRIFFAKGVSHVLSSPYSALEI